MKYLSLLLTGMLLAFSSGTSLADDEGLDNSLLANFPVLESGREVPLDTFARHKLLAFSGKSTFEKQPAIDWLAKVLFTPDDAAKLEIFLVDNPEVLQAVGYEADSRGRYSYEQLKPYASKLQVLARQAIQLEEQSRAPVEKEILKVYHNLMHYRDISEALDFTVPDKSMGVANPLNVERLGLEGPGPLSFADLYLKMGALSSFLEGLHVPQEEWPAGAAELKRAVDGMAAWSQGKSGSPLGLFPIEGHNGSWLSPWDSIILNNAPQELRGLIGRLNDMASAYRAGNQVAYDLAARHFLETVTESLNAEVVRNLKVEIQHNKFNPFRKAEMLYGFGFLLSLVALTRKGKLAYRIALVLTAAALIPHTLGILFRMEIMGRPPVTNLYSTFLFVGWVSTLLCLALEYFQKSRLGVLAASFSGLALLLTAARFSAEGDNMGVMVAVLDSNFWLATHVITITMGYAGCVVSGVLGHIYLIQAIVKKEDDPALVDTYKAVYGTMAFGLIFSFLGTMLGGVWADQSWGRFWGWDPKENGALVICLWSAILFHAKTCRMIGPRGFAAGAVLGIIWVLMAWIGVNLLGVGLHSYGFTSSLALGLLISTVVEIAFLAAVLPLAGKKNA